MRFYAHDGSTLHGPSEVAELLNLPGFDGDTLVCPVGSENSSDWKPALLYPPFREVLLAPTPKTAPVQPSALKCSRCGRTNPKDSRYCNECGSKMGAPLPEEPVIVPEPAVVLPPTTVTSTRIPSHSKLIATITLMSVAGVGLGYWFLRTPPPKPAKTPAPVETPIETPAIVSSTTTSILPMPVVTTAPVVAPPPPVVIEKPAPVEAPPPPPPARKVKIKRKKKTRKANVIKNELAPTPAPPAKEPEPAPAPTSQPPIEKSEPSHVETHARMMLPGVPLPGVPPRPEKKTETKAEPVAAATQPEDGTTRQVREQFEFCAQLLTQGAMDDHFETCLCPDARKSAPYHGQRSNYVTTLKKLAAAGMLETSAHVTGIVLQGDVAQVTAKWKMSSTGKEREVAERWRLDGGLWCREP